jgi:hypothetical protein
VIGAFENHKHAYKRTVPLLANNPVLENGTTYFGDGALGAIPKHDCDIVNNDLPIFAVKGVINNLFVSYVSDDQVINHAYNIEGDIMDTFVQKTAYFKEV